MAPFQKLLVFLCFSLDKAQIFGIIDRAVAAAFYMQWYRSGHNEHDWKSCCRQKRHEGSNPSHCAILTKRYRCVWRKVRRINRFRAFSGPDFFFQTIDANRRFRASAPIRTGRFPFLGRCIQPVPFLNGDFSGWQRYFPQKNSQRFGRRFVDPDGLRKRHPFSFQKGRWSQRLHL